VEGGVKEGTVGAGVYDGSDGSGEGSCGEVSLAGDTCREEGRSGSVRPRSRSGDNLSSIVRSGERRVGEEYRLLFGSIIGGGNAKLPVEALVWLLRASSFVTRIARLLC